MYLSPRLKKWLWAMPPLVLLCLPGWGGSLRSFPHETMLARLRRTSDVFGVTRQAEQEGGEWHVTYADSTAAGLLSTLNLRTLCTYVVPPDYVAYIAPGARMADDYYLVETRLRWPWWWPGGGVEWVVPE